MQPENFGRKEVEIIGWDPKDHVLSWAENLRRLYPKGALPNLREVADRTKIAETEGNSSVQALLDATNQKPVTLEEQEGDPREQFLGKVMSNLWRVAIRFKPGQQPREELTTDYEITQSTAENPLEPLVMACHIPILQRQLKRVLGIEEKPSQPPEKLKLVRTFDYPYAEWATELAGEEILGRWDFSMLEEVRREMRDILANHSRPGVFVLILQKKGECRFYPLDAQREDERDKNWRRSHNNPQITARFKLSQIGVILRKLGELKREEPPKTREQETQDTTTFRDMQYYEAYQKNVRPDFLVENAVENDPEIRELLIGSIPDHLPLPTWSTSDKVARDKRLKIIAIKIGKTTYEDGTPESEDAALLLKNFH